MVLVAGVTLCACSPPASGQICEAAVIPYEPMIYPAPNATGVPDGNFTLVLAAPAQTALMINGAGPLRSAAVPNPLPTPYSTPSPTPSEYSGYAVGPLAAATTYTVTESGGAGTACPYTQTFGQFTTR